MKKAHASRTASRSASHTLSGDEFEAVNMLFDAAVESIDSPPFLVPSTLILVPARYLSRGYHLDSTSRTFLRQFAMRMEMSDVDGWGFVDISNLVLESRVMTQLMTHDSEWSCSSALQALVGILTQPQESQHPSEENRQVCSS
jgi:hypothetical protein